MTPRMFRHLKMFPSSRQRKGRRGLSLIEGVLYLVVSLAILVGGLAFYRQFVLSERITDTSRMITVLTAETRTLFTTQGGLGNTYIEDYLVGSGVVGGNHVARGRYPDSGPVAGFADAYLSLASGGEDAGGRRTASGKVIRHAWNGQVAVYGAENFFVITMSGLPQSACLRLAKIDTVGRGLLGTGIFAIDANGNVAPAGSFPVTLEEADRLCGSGSNTLRLGYLESAAPVRTSSPEDTSPEEDEPEGSPDPDNPPDPDPVDSPASEDPVTPSDPDDPPDSENPVTPEDPEDPVAPEDPEAPENPEGPVDPSEPADPADPEDTADPEDPADPIEPEDPFDPEDPDNPEDPAGPDEPDTPETPTDPDDPAAPIDPQDPETQFDYIMPTVYWPNEWGNFADWGHTVTSKWIDTQGDSFFKAGEPFKIWGPGEPTLQLEGGTRASEGIMSRWGTNIVLDPPPCGESEYIYLENAIGEVGRLELARPAWTPEWGPPPPSCD